MADVKAYIPQAYRETLPNNQQSLGRRVHQCHCQFRHNVFQSQDDL